jgi:adenylyl-sulfate kinase
MTREEYEELNYHKALCVWFTGLSGAGKTTIAEGLESKLFWEAVSVVGLDGDRLRNVWHDLGFSPGDRKTNVRRAGRMAKLLFDYGHVVLCSFISPYAEDREYVRSLFPDGKFVLVHVSCPVEECKKRDPKGLYKKAAAGEITDLTGVSAPYEQPAADVVVDTSLLSVKQAIQKVYDYVGDMI